MLVLVCLTFLCVVFTLVNSQRFFLLRTVIHHTREIFAAVILRDYVYPLKIADSGEMVREDDLESTALIWTLRHRKSLARPTLALLRCLFPTAVFEGESITMFLLRCDHAEMDALHTAVLSHLRYNAHSHSQEY